MSEEFKNNLPSDDDFILGKGFEIEETQVEYKRKPKKGKNKLKIAVTVILIFAISIGLAFGIIYAGADYIGVGFGRGEEVVMEIAPGSSTTKIAKQLKQSGAVKIPLLFRLYAKVKGYESSFKYGLYTFSSEAGYSSIANMLINEGAKAESVTVTIPEGTGINDYTKNVNGENVTIPGIATILENKGICTKSDFLDALDEVKTDSKLLSSIDSDKTYYALEGYLFPETYDFYSYDSKECAVLAVKRMIKETEKRITEDMYEKAEKQGYSINQILTMASIIQMESGNDVSALPKIAGVFYNRLNSKDFETLGSSPTCYYGKSFKHDDGRYDTYKAKGLPPGPLCSPGIDAINAALNPETSDYYYFVTDKNGKFYFHKTLEEQNKTINKLKQDKNWIYEYFN